MARGDQIYVIREFWNLEGIYQHHGIDCGDGNVIHYRKVGEATVAQTPMDLFTRGSYPVYVKRYDYCYAAETTLQRAESRLGEQKYNLLFNNCEHFATWCKTGVSHSEQVRDFVPAISQLDPKQLQEPIRQSLQDARRPDAPSLLDRALADIRVVWDSLQPQYNREVEEIQTWHRVAVEALERDREDLARAALQRQQKHRKRATELKTKLDRLAQMTETLLRDRDLIE